MAILNQFAELVLYRLKRDYGQPLRLYKLLDSTTDVQTGQKHQTIATYFIPLAIALPGEWQRVRGVERTTVAKGSYDVEGRPFIIDRQDVPVETLTADDWFVLRHVKYQIIKVEEFEIDAAWLVHARALVGEIAQQELDETATDAIRLEDSCGAA
jgi:hypothetical protein